MICNQANDQTLTNASQWYTLVSAASSENCIVIGSLTLYNTSGNAGQFIFQTATDGQTWARFLVPAGTSVMAGIPGTRIASSRGAFQVECTQAGCIATVTYGYVPDFQQPA